MIKTENIFSYNSPSSQKPIDPTKSLYAAKRSPRVYPSTTSEKAPPANIILGVEAIDFWTDQAMSGDDLSHCDPDLLPKIILSLISIRDQYLVSNLTDLSQKADDALKMAKTAHKNSLVKNASISLRSDLKKRLISAKEAYNEALENIARNEANLVKHLEDAKRTVDDRQKREMDDLRIEWESPQKLRSYNRTSTLLRELRRQAVYLLNEKKYDESRSVTKRADKIEKNEIETNHLLMQNDYEEQIQILTKKQRDETEILTKSQEGKMKEFEIAKNAEILIHQKRIEKIEREIETTLEPEKVWALHHRNDQPEQTLNLATFSNKPKTPTVFVRRSYPRMKSKQKDEENEEEDNEEKHNNKSMKTTNRSCEHNLNSTDDYNTDDYAADDYINDNNNNKNDDEIAENGNEDDENIDELNNAKRMKSGKRKISTAINNKRRIGAGEFTSLELPPLMGRVKTKKMMQKTQRYFRFNKNFI